MLLEIMERNVQKNVHGIMYIFFSKLFMWQFLLEETNEFLRR